MEHLIFYLVVEGIQALDRKLQRPLNKVVPDLQILCADPAAYLSQTTVVIGPRKRQALALVVGFAVALVTVGFLFVAFDFIPPPKKGEASRVFGVLATFVVTIFAVRGLMLHWLRGGTLTLRREGAELDHRGRSLFLPWALFRAPGVSFQPDVKQIVLPIDATVPTAIAGPRDEVVAVYPIDIDLSQAVGCDVNQLALRDLYRVPIGEVGEFLLGIGRAINGGVVDAVPTWHTFAPLAVPEDNGWLRIQLTQLPFPPYCVGCGDFTQSEHVEPLFAARNKTKLSIPMCDACRRGWRRGIYWGLLGGAIVAIAGGIAAFFLMVTLRPNARPGSSIAAGVTTFAILSIPALIGGAMVGGRIRVPFRWKQYKPDSGTVRLRVRWPDRAEPLLRALGLEVPQPPPPPEAD